MRRRPSDTTPLTAAQARLVADHAEWARSGAAKYADRWRRLITEDELVSACHLGLVLAARNFDPRRGLAFKTLALYYCESLMRRELNTARRLDGHVYDARVEGGMRTVLQRIVWPEYDDGRPVDLVTMPADQIDAVDAAHRRALVLAVCPVRKRGMLRLALAGHSTQEIARRLKRRPSAVDQALAQVVPVVRARLARRQAVARARAAA